MFVLKRKKAISECTQSFFYITLKTWSEKLDLTILISHIHVNKNESCFFSERRKKNKSLFFLSKNLFFWNDQASTVIARFLIIFLFRITKIQSTIFPQYLCAGDGVVSSTTIRSTHWWDLLTTLCEPTLFRSKKQ